MMNESCILVHTDRAPSRSPSGWAAATLGALVALAAPGFALADCIDDAAQHHRVNSPVLRAIGWHESRLRAGAINNANRNGSVDVGAFMTNSIHFPTLASWGVKPNDLLDGCKSAYVGAWMYRKCIDQLGDSWHAVGCYHSMTEPRVAWYADEVYKILMKWGKVPQGTTPFAAAVKLHPNTPNPPGVRKVTAQIAAAQVFTPAQQPSTQVSAADTRRASPAQVKPGATVSAADDSRLSGGGTILDETVADDSIHANTHSGEVMSQ